MPYVNSQSLEDLRCASCRKYLSHFPIYLEPCSGNSICGRCHPSETAIHNTVYQIAVQHQKFPCCNNDSGCIENLYPNDIPQHERLCSFRKLPCQIFASPGCDWIGFPKDILEHFEVKHPIFILGEGNFEIDFVHSYKENYLLPYGEELFVVRKRTDSTANIFLCTVIYVGTNPATETFNYKLIMENNSKTKSHEIVQALNTTAEISGDIIRSILDDPVAIIGRIEIFHEEPPDVQNNTEEEEKSLLNYEMLRDLECAICLEYMVPPIYQCVTGHSFCKTCKESLESENKSCPTCKKEIQNTQNFALAQIINHIPYPCKHDRCQFVGRAKDIKQHEITCMWGPFKCPLNDYLGCNGTAIFTEIYDHVLNNHYENLLEMETVSVPWNDEEDNEDCYILRYGNKLFKLHFLYSEEQLKLTMQFIGPAEESKNYKFEIDFIDNSGNNNRVYFKAKCSPLTDAEDAFEDEDSFLGINWPLIEQLVTNELSFRVKIIQA